MNSLPADYSSTTTRNIPKGCSSSSMEGHRNTNRYNIMNRTLFWTFSFIKLTAVLTISCIVSNRTFYVCDLPGQNLICCIYALVTGAATKPPSLACRHLPFLFGFLPVVDAWHPHESKLELGGERLFSVFVNRLHWLAVILYETLVSFLYNASNLSSNSCQLSNLSCNTIAIFKI